VHNGKEALGSFLWDLAPPCGFLEYVFIFGCKQMPVFELTSL